jgi:hypothetical protein
MDDDQKWNSYVIVLRHKPIDLISNGVFKLFAYSISCLIVIGYSHKYISHSWSDAFVRLLGTRLFRFYSQFMKNHSINMKRHASLRLWSSPKLVVWGGNIWIKGGLQPKYSQIRE